MDAIEQFKGAMRAHGLTPPENIIPDGKLHRFSSNGRRGDDAGWYVLHGDGIPAGCFGDWRTDIKKSWRADLGRPLTPTEEAAHQRKVDAMRRVRDAEIDRRRVEAAKKSRSLWAAASSVREIHPHPYLNVVKDKGGKVTIHTLRHTFASRLVQAGVSLVKVSKLLGHSSVTTTEIYAHLAPNEVSEEATRC